MGGKHPTPFNNLQEYEILESVSIVVFTLGDI